MSKWLPRNKTERKAAKKAFTDRVKHLFKRRG
jgi:hypothetical protein